MLRAADTLIPRILTALVLLPAIILIILFLPSFYFTLVIAAIVALAAWEWSRLGGYTRIKSRCLYSLFVLLFFWLVLLLLPQKIVLLTGVASWTVLLIYIVYARTQITLPSLSTTWVLFLGAWLLAFFGEALLFLHTKPCSLLALLLMVCLADTGAYFGGRFFGKHALAPLISPGKTYEGFIVGLLASLIFAFFVYPVFMPSYSSRLEFLGITLITVFMSVIGDLWESLLKRLSGLKESGTLLPGHGGILDRIDSLLAAAPVFAASFIIKQFSL